MKFQRNMAICALALFAQTGLAAEQGFYFGVFGGRADYDFDEVDVPVLAQPSFNPDFLPITRLEPIFFGPPAFGSGFVLDAMPALWLPRDDDRSTAWGALVGYRATPHIAAELSYMNLGTLEANDSLHQPPILGGGTLRLHREIETTGPAVSALGILPASEQWDFYVRAGVLFADMKFSSSIEGGNTASTTFGSESVLWGVGTQFNWGDHWSVRVDFQRFNDVGRDDWSEADIDLLSLGVLYRL